MSGTRRWYRAGSAVLLIGAGIHLTAHWHAYVVPDLSEPLRRAAVDAMQAHVLYAPLGTTLWTAMGFYSLAFGATLALFGTTHWILAREAEPRTLRRHALRNSLLCSIAALAALALHPLPHGLVILSAAAVLFGFAAWPRPLDL